MAVGFAVFNDRVTRGVVYLVGRACGILVHTLKWVLWGSKPARWLRVHAFNGGL